jgi:hypothetical protein
LEHYDRFNLLMCGSAVEAAAFGVLMGEERAATVFTRFQRRVRSRLSPPAASQANFRIATVERRVIFLIAV